MTTQLVMLDFDGVIVDSLDLTLDAAVAVLKRHRLPGLVTREAVLSLLDSNRFEGLARAGVPSGVSLAIDKAVSRALEAHAEVLRPVPGMRRTISALSSEHTVTIITSNYSRFVAEFLRRNEVTGISDVMAADEGTSKTRKIEKALAMHGCSEAAWYVGDTVGDIVEARLAGVRPIAATWGWHSVERLLAASPDAVAHAPCDLLGII